MSIDANLVWLCLIVLFVVVEAVTVSLASIWFAGGALLALICSLIGLDIWVQIAVFFISSIILLVFTRKIFVGKLKVGGERTNVDALIGQRGIIIEDVNKFENGEVKINGLSWMAATNGKEKIPEGTEVEIVAIEGVKLLVVPVGDIQDKAEDKILNSDS